MNKLIYEVHWHYINDVFSHCTVTPITVLHESMLPGCTTVSITAIDSEGYKFKCSPNDYYATEEDAWLAVKTDLTKNIKLHEKRLAELQMNIAAQRKYLDKLVSN